MYAAFEALCQALDEVSDATEKAWGDDRTLLEAYGQGVQPPLTRHDLANLAALLAKDLRQVPDDCVDEGLLPDIDGLVLKIGLLKTHTVPGMFSQNNPQFVWSFISTITYCRDAIGQAVGWQAIPSKSTILPIRLKRQLQTVKSDLDSMMADRDDLAQKCSLIVEAHSAAEELPTSLADLKSAKDQLSALEKAAVIAAGSISSNEKTAASALEEIEKAKAKSLTLVEKCEEAYRITTSKGLAGAFDERAQKLAQSTRAWVVGLVFSLAAMVYLGAHRIDKLLDALAGPVTDWSVVWIRLFISTIAIGAPLWFAWLATKQIGRNFRLSEDYAFKASVAKAYEGYRREAVDLDSAFQRDLFASALNRLDEAPLRLLDKFDHSSPWMEAISNNPVTSIFRQRQVPPPQVVAPPSPTADVSSQNQNLATLDPKKSTSSAANT